LHYDLENEQKEAYQKMLNGGIGYYDNLSEIGFEEWQSEIAEVREGMKRWHHITMFENMCNGDTGKVSILQTDREGNTTHNKWLGCEVEKESELMDVDSFVIYNSEAIELRETEPEKIPYNAGIIFEAWPEFIPYKKQTAGMVFHCDQPDNEAPQTLLLAYHPEFNVTENPQKKWSRADVLTLLDSTRFMLMNRAVEPDHIYQHEELSTIFPLLSNIEISKNKIKSDIL
jgi:hypothetical protein